MIFNCVLKGAIDNQFDQSEISQNEDSGAIFII
jgi:hypothetical protein